MKTEHTLFPGMTHEMVKERVHNLFEAIRQAGYEHEMQKRIEALNKANASAAKAADRKAKTKKTLTAQ